MCTPMPPAWCEMGLEWEQWRHAAYIRGRLDKVFAKQRYNEENGIDAIPLRKKYKFLDDADFDKTNNETGFDKTAGTKIIDFAYATRTDNNPNNSSNTSIMSITNTTSITSESNSPTTSICSDDCKDRCIHTINTISKGTSKKAIAHTLKQHPSDEYLDLKQNQEFKKNSTNPLPKSKAGSLKMAKKASATTNLTLTQVAATTNFDKSLLCDLALTPPCTTSEKIRANYDAIKMTKFG